MGRRDTLTVIVLPDGAGRPRTMVLRRRWLRIAAFAGLFCIAGLILLAFSYRSLRRHVDELAYMQAESSSQRMQLASMSEEIEGLNDQLQRLQKLDRKLRLLASLEPTTATDSRPGTDTTPIFSFEPASGWSGATR